MQDHVGKHVAVDAKMAFTSPTFVPPTLTSLLLLAVLLISLRAINLAILLRLASIPVAGRRLAKGNETAHALFASLFAGTRPRDCGPVAQREEMVV